MSIPNLPELMLILFVVLLIFGAGKLPDVASSLGKSIKEFRTGLQVGEPANNDDKVDNSKEDVNA
jgi:sec-independent protein translocase protein TatA